MAQDDPISDLLLVWEEAYSQGHEMSVADLCLDRLELLPELRKRIAALRAVEGVLQKPPPPAPPSDTPVISVALQVDPLLRACLAAPQQPDELGRLGPYRVLKLLGAGGMGAVFQAEDPLLQRQVALKVMLPRLDPSEQVRERFLREAQMSAQLKHEHIVTIHHVGEERGVPYLAMELLHGESLEARLKREGKLPVAEVERIGREIALGLAAAHANGVIHRDIKPANVWLETIADCGLRIADSGQSAIRNPQCTGSSCSTSVWRARWLPRTS